MSNVEVAEPADKGGAMSTVGTILKVTAVCAVILGCVGGAVFASGLKGEPLGARGRYFGKNVANKKNPWKPSQGVDGAARSQIALGSEWTAARYSQREKVFGSADWDMDVASTLTRRVPMEFCREGADVVKEQPLYLRPFMRGMLTIAGAASTSSGVELGRQLWSLDRLYEDASELRPMSASIKGAQTSDSLDLQYRATRERALQTVQAECQAAARGVPPPAPEAEPSKDGYEGVEGQEGKPAEESAPEPPAVRAGSVLVGDAKVEAEALATEAIKTQALLEMYKLVDEGVPQGLPESLRVPLCGAEWQEGMDACKLTIERSGASADFVEMMFLHARLESKLELLKGYVPDIAAAHLAESAYGDVLQLEQRIPEERPAGLEGSRALLLDLVTKTGSFITVRADHILDTLISKQQTHGHLNNVWAAEAKELLAIADTALFKKSISEATKRKLRSASQTKK